MSDMTTQAAAETVGEQPPTGPKAKKKAGVRQPGRPHRRLDDPVLTAHKMILKKKLVLLQAKQTICEERLQSYEDEEEKRIEAGNY
jgi:hypothetical protein